MLNFWISNVSIFYEKKTIVLQNFLIKSRIHTIKTFLKNLRKQLTGKIEKKDVKNTKKLKKQIVKDEILKMFCI